MALNKKDAETILTRAIKHLESLYPESVGMHTRKPFSYPDYAAYRILLAARDLVRYTGK